MIFKGLAIITVEKMILFKIFFYHEISYIFRSKGRIFSNIFYFLIILSIFQILTQNFDKNIQPNLLIIVSMIALICSITTINHELFEKDFRDGTLEQIIIHCQNIEIFVIAKFIAHWLSTCLAIIVIASLYSQLISTNMLNFWHIFGTLILTSLSLFFLFAFCGSLSMVGGVASMASVIALPLALPILIISSASILDDFYSNIKILFGLTLFITTMASFGCGKIIRIANN